jgi:hypothetical protein
VRADTGGVVDDDVLAHNKVGNIHRGLRTFFFFFLFDLI